MPPKQQSINKQKADEAAKKVMKNLIKMGLYNTLKKKGMIKKKTK